MHHRPLLAILLLLVLICSACSTKSPAEIQAKLDKRSVDARNALAQLYRITPGAKDLGNNASGVLVFPDVTKAGFLIGGQYGNGVLFENGQATGYFNTTAASYGLQAGAQTFGYAMFFMSPEDLKYLKKSDGWEIGVGPSIVVADKGFSNSMTTTTAKKGVYVFFFEQKGLMAGLGIQGTKITQTN